MTQLPMRVAVEGFEGDLKIGGRLVTNLRYANDSVLVDGTEKELQALVGRLHGAAVEFRMKINVKTEEIKNFDTRHPQIS